MIPNNLDPRPSKPNRLIQYALFCTVLMMAVLCITPLSGQSQNKIKKEVLPDGVEHWYHVSETEAKPWFFRQLENIFEVVLPNSSNKLPFGKSIAFLVGVSRYEHITPQLPFVAQDLKRLRQFFLETGGFDEVYVAQDSVVTKKLIETYMVNIFRKRFKNNPNDRLLFYYSGHGADFGGTTGYLQFAQARPDDFWNHVIPVNRCEGNHSLPPLFGDRFGSDPFTTTSNSLRNIFPWVMFSQPACFYDT